MTRRHALVAAAALAALALPLVVSSSYVLHIAILAGVYIVLVQSFNLVLGYCGLLSFASPAFFGIGAYVASLLALRMGWDTIVTLPLAVAGGILAAILVGFPSLRVSRHAFVIVTLAATLLLQLLALNWEDMTRGSLGLPSIPPPKLFGIALKTRVEWYYLSIAAAAAAVLCTWMVVGSRFGRALVATRDNEQLATACGINVFRTRLFAFSLSGGLAAAGGALYAHFITYIDPGVFGFSVTESLLVMVILGGSGTLWGPIAGAVVFTALPELLRMTPEIRSLVYGVILLVIVVLRPRKLFP